MIVHTNWNMDLKTIYKLHKEVLLLSKKFGDIFDWRILSHPISIFPLKKTLKNEKFLKYANPNSTDKILIQFLNSKKEILKVSDLNKISPQNLMNAKSKDYLDRISHYKYRLNQKGIDYLISKFYIRWCKYKKKDTQPLQRVVIYRLATYKQILPTINNFSSKMGFNHLWVSFHERGKLILRPILIKKLMENIKANFKEEIEENILSKDKIGDIYNLLGKERYHQICNAAKQIHPSLRKKLTREQYRIYQTTRLKNTKPSIFEEKIIHKLKQYGQKFEVHPNIYDYHFDFALPKEENPKIIIEAISYDWYIADKINYLRKKLPKTTFVAIVYDNIRDASLLLFKNHFDVVCKFSNLDFLLENIENKITKEKKSEVLVEINNKSSTLWQGEAEKSIKNILERHQLIQDKDYYHEPAIRLKWDNGRDRFLPDFMIPDRPKKKGIILEATSLNGHRSTLRGRIGKIISRFEIYKTIAKLDHQCIAALYIKNKDFIKNYEIERLRNSPYCDVLLINEQINELPKIVGEAENGR